MTDLEVLRFEARKLHAEKLKALADVAKVQYKITELEFKIADCELAREIALGDGKCNSLKKKRIAELFDDEPPTKERKVETNVEPINPASKHMERKPNTDVEVIKPASKPMDQSIHTAPQSTPIKTIPVPRCPSPVRPITPMPEHKKSKKNNNSKRKLDMNPENKSSRPHKHRGEGSKSSKRRTQKSLQNLQKAIVNCNQMIKLTVESRETNATDNRIELQEPNANQMNIVNNTAAANKQTQRIDWFDSNCQTTESIQSETPVIDYEKELQKQKKLLCHIPVQLIGRPLYKNASQDKQGQNDYQIDWPSSKNEDINNNLFKELREQKPLKIIIEEEHSISSAVTLVLINDSVEY